MIAQMKTLPDVMQVQLERASRWMFTRIISALARSIHDDDLSVVQLAALHLIDQGGGMKQSVLGETLGMSPSSTSRMVDALVGRELVERRESPEDRRLRVLRLTDRGAMFLAEMGKERVALFLRITRPIPRAVIEVFLDTIDHARSQPEV
jgi:DNA-binding MarR family transcriptional regulator